MQTIATFPLLSLKANSGTQFRAEMCDDQVEGLMDLIGRGVKWKTPIQIAKQDGLFYLTDGFHRVAAYVKAGIAEIPAGQFEIVECESLDDVIYMSMRANAAHGNKNSVEDRVLMMNKLIQMDEARFMNGSWEVSQKEVAAALQITKMQAQAACQPKNDELKARRDAAVLELHKDGKSQRKIGEALGVTHKVVAKVLGEVVPNHEPIFGATQESSPSVLPQANTSDRPDTRIQHDAFLAQQMRELGIDLDETITLTEGEETEDLSDDIDLNDMSVPWNDGALHFDVLGCTGYGEELTRYNISVDSEKNADLPHFSVAGKGITEDAQVEEAKRDPVAFQSAYDDLLDELIKFQRIAALAGIPLTQYAEAA